MAAENRCAEESGLVPAFGVSMGQFLNVDMKKVHVFVQILTYEKVLVI